MFVLQLDYSAEKTAEMMIIRAKKHHICHYGAIL
jgi:hypothetical protein